MINRSTLFSVRNSARCTCIVGLFYKVKTLLLYANVILVVILYIWDYQCSVQKASIEQCALFLCYKSINFMGKNNSKERYMYDKSEAVQNFYL